MPVTSDRLLLALAEELKTPLLQIAREAERTRLVEAFAQPVIEQTADMALRLIDSFILSLSIQPSLELEPLTISSALYDSAHELDTVAKQFDRELVVDIKSKYGPVMARREHIVAAFIMLGYQALTQPNSSEDTQQVVTLGAHKSRHGIVAGVFSNSANLTADAFRRAQAFGGTARQTFPSASHMNGAGMLLADSLLRSLSAPLKPSRHQKQSGLAATFLQSSQLTLV